MNIKIENSNNVVLLLGDTDNFFIETNKLSNNSLERKIIVITNSISELEGLFNKFSELTGEIKVSISDKEVQIIEFISDSQDMMVSESTEKNENKLMISFILSKE